MAYQQQQQPPYHPRHGSYESTELTVTLCGSLFKLTTSDDRMFLAPYRSYHYPRELRDLKEKLRGRLELKITRVNLRHLRRALDEHVELQRELQRLVGAVVHGLVNLLRELGDAMDAKSPCRICIFETKNRPLYLYEREHQQHQHRPPVMESFKLVLNLNAQGQYPDPAACEQQINKPHSLRTLQQLGLFLRMINCSADLPALARDLERHSLSFALRHRNPLSLPRRESDSQDGEGEAESPSDDSLKIVHPSTYLLQRGAPLFHSPRAALFALPPISPMLYHLHSPFFRHPWTPLKRPHQLAVITTAAAAFTATVTATTAPTAVVRPILLLRRPQMAPQVQTPRRTPFYSSLLMRTPAPAATTASSSAPPPPPLPPPPPSRLPTPPPMPTPPPPGFENVPTDSLTRHSLDRPPVGRRSAPEEVAHYCYVDRGVESANDDPFPAERPVDDEEDDQQHQLLLSIVRQLLSNLPLETRSSHEKKRFYSEVVGAPSIAAGPFHCVHRDSLKMLKVSDRVPCWFCVPQQQRRTSIDARLSVAAPPFVPKTSS